MEQGERVGREREEEMEFGAQWGNAKTVMFSSPSDPSCSLDDEDEERTRSNQTFTAFPCLTKFRLPLDAHHDRAHLCPEFVSVQIVLSLPPSLSLSCVPLHA